jgi:cation transport regulator ChaC
MNATKTFYYFAYGSNLMHSEIRRSCPTAERKCRAMLPDHALGFPRKSEGRQCGVASIEPRAGSEVWGGVYEIPESERGRLESREGFKPNRALAANAYVPRILSVFVDGDAAKPVDVMTFIANPQPDPPLPNAEYKSLIIVGAREWKLQAEYIAGLEQIKTSNDNDTRLLTELKATAAKLNYSPEALIVLGAAAVQHQQTSIMPNFPPFPQISDEAVIDTEILAVWPDWVEKLIPAGSKWQRLEWPNGGVTIRLIDTQRAVVAAAYTSPTENKLS